MFVSIFNTLSEQYGMQYIMPLGVRTPLPHLFQGPYPKSGPISFMEMDVEDDLTFSVDLSTLILHWTTWEA